VIEVRVDVRKIERKGRKGCSVGEREGRRSVLVGGEWECRYIIKFMYNHQKGPVTKTARAWPCGRVAGDSFPKERRNGNKWTRDAIPPR
jgi:hypothetical protein